MVVEDRVWSLWDVVDSEDHLESAGMSLNFDFLDWSTDQTTQTKHENQQTAVLDTDNKSKREHPFVFY